MIGAVAGILRNQHRRRILEILYTRKSASPKEIAEDLKIGVPTVYYHLELLRGYVQRTARGEFSITERGLEAYKKEVLGEPSPIGAPAAALYWIVSRPCALLLAGFAAAAAELLACLALGYTPIFLGYVPVLDLSWAFPGYAMSVLGTFAVLEASSLAITRRTGGELPLLGGIMVSRAPLMLLFLIPALGVGGSAVSVAVTGIAQLLSVFSASAFLSLSRGIRQERSIIVCLFILYGNILVYSWLW